MRVGAILLAAIPLAACAASVGYGTADYNSIRKATEDCQAGGGHLALKSGYDGRQLSSYVCQKGKAPS